MVIWHTHTFCNRVSYLSEIFQSKATSSIEKKPQSIYLSDAEESIHDAVRTLSFTIDLQIQKWQAPHEYVKINITVKYM